MASNKKEQEYIDSLKKQEESTVEDNLITDKLGRDDRELIIVYNEAEGVFYADTSIPKFWRRLEKKNWECINTQYYADGTVCSKSFRGSKKGITIGDPFKKRELTDEQREKIRQRFSKSSTENDIDEEEVLEDDFE